jgi:hypothetical protein
MKSTKRRASARFVKKLWRESHDVPAIARQISYTQEGTRRLLNRLGLRPYTR